MLDRINFAWRWLATAFSFFMFGLGGMLIPLIVVPVLYCMPGDAEKREQRGQKFIHYSFGRFIWMMKVLGVLTYTVTDVHRLKKAQLVLANHPSLLDVVFLISLIPNANCVIKSSLLKNPFMRGPIRAAGYIVNDGDADDVIIAAKNVFNKHQAMIIFPEGTRTEPLHAVKLKRGAANIAVRTAVDITPVLISCIPTTLTKRDRWYQIPKKAMHFQITVKDNIAITPYLFDSTSGKGARALTQDLTTYFNNEALPNE
jgi:1-acyl-sn-glycerol-3-phosphate acyltransferase